MSSGDVDTDDGRLADNTGTPLRTLTSEGRRLVDPAFLRGERTYADEVGQYVDEHTSDVHVELQGLRADLQAVVDSYDQYDSTIDAAAAPAVHRRLDISRRIAADPGVWHYLAVVEFPEFVRYRWEFNTETAMREKFLGAGTDIYSNALHRLWWIAELTHDGDDYSLTEEVLQKQTLANKIFDRWFARYRPAAVACCAKLVDESTEVAEEVTLRLNRVFSTRQLEGMDEAELGRLIQDLVTDIQNQGTTD
ncbi:DUF6339 family protein [Halomarina rubra]|uniref:DUF6339 family protein n=1 Tax=Halomarina rubra TaxID=2071873 RepID=A0ABD6AV55_9EURY|nr:DUF6339 family protein [Halomarina rubra]